MNADIKIPGPDDIQPVAKPINNAKHSKKAETKVAKPKLDEKPDRIELSPEGKRALQKLKEKDAQSLDNKAEKNREFQERSATIRGYD